MENRSLVISPTHGIDLPGFKLTRNGMEPVGTPSFEQWQQAGEFVKQAGGAVHFWIGDWLNYGEKNYGESYTQAIELTGFDYATLSTDKWVARQVESSRRRENLSFDHHRSVAELMPDEQEELLTRAVENEIPGKEFRKIVRKYKLRLDLPELSEEDLEPVSKEEFDEAQARASLLLSVTEDIKSLRWAAFEPEPRDYLLSQVKKSVGILGRILQDES